MFREDQELQDEQFTPVITALKADGEVHFYHVLHGLMISINIFSHLCMLGEASTWHLRKL